MLLAVLTSWCEALIFPPSWKASVREVMVGGKPDKVRFQDPSFLQRPDVQVGQSYVVPHAYQQNFGWPIKTLGVQYVQQSVPPRFSVRTGFGINLGDVRRIPNPDFALYSIPLALPIVPTLWFPASVGLWAVALLTITQALRTLLGWNRKRRGFCAHCAYSAGSSRICPECGKTR